MRRPRITNLSVVVVAAVILATTGCGVAADDTAATVGGTVIEASQVNELATSDAFMTAMTSQALKDQRPGVIPGDDARQVLAFLIQREVLAQEVERWEVEVTDGDRSKAEQTIEQQAPQLDASQRSLVAGFLADRDALAARLGKLSGSKESDLRRMYDALGSQWDQVCLTAVAVPAGDVAAARRALDGGAKLEDLSKRVKQAQVVATGDRCVAVRNLPTVLRDDVGRSAKGVVVGPVRGIYPGDEAVLWYVVGSRRRLSFDAARDQLRQLAESLAQQGVASWITLKVNEDVTINPRYGSEVQVEQSGLSVTPPPVPQGVVPASAGGAAADGAGSSATP